MIKAIVFDYGNVISEKQDTECYARMAALSDLSEDYFLHAFWKYRDAFDRGTLRGIDMYRTVLTEGGITIDDAELTELAKKLLNEDMLSWSRVSQTTTDWALSLQQSGYRIGILSNMPWDFLDAYEHVIELFKKADTIVFSCMVAHIKPEKEIYRLLAQRIQCKAEEIVFFDDLQVNIDGARAAGINAFLWTGLEKAQQDLVTLIAPEAPVVTTYWSCLSAQHKRQQWNTSHRK